MSELMYQKAKELIEKICGQMEAHLIESIISLFNRGVLVHKVRSPRMSLDQNNFKMTVEAASGVSFEGREVIVQLETELAELKAERDELKIDLSTAINYLEQGHKKFTPNVTNSFVLDLINKYNAKWRKD